MNRATLRFYEELNHFIPATLRKTDIEIQFKTGESVKDMIEALGVPHTEVDLILINGVSVDFSYILQDEDRISVYPVFESLDIKGVTHLREIPLRRTRFIADVNIMDIVRVMRAMGFDVHADPTLTPRGIIDCSKKEKRTILTKSRKLLKHKNVTHGIFIRPGTLREQIRRILSLLDLFHAITPFSRCLLCNGLLIEATKEQIDEQAPPRVKQRCSQYAYCTHCRKVYWKGTHHEHMKALLEEILHPTPLPFSS